MSMYLDTTVALILKMIHSGISNDNDNIVRFVLSKFANDFRISSTFPHLTNATCKQIVLFSVVLCCVVLGLANVLCNVHCIYSISIFAC